MLLSPPTTAGHSSCFYLLGWQLKTGDFFPWKLWDTVLKQFSHIDFQRVPISFCFLSLFCLNTCKIACNNSVFDSLKIRGLEIGWSFISKYAFLANHVVMELFMLKWVILAVYFTVFRSLNNNDNKSPLCAGYRWHTRTHTCSEIVFMAFLALILAHLVQFLALVLIYYY